MPLFYSVQEGGANKMRGKEKVVEWCQIVAQMFVIWMKGGCDNDK